MDSPQKGVFNLVVNGKSEVRIDKYLTSRIDVSRNQNSKLIKEGKVRVNGAQVKPNYTVRIGDVVSVEIPKPEKPDITPEDIPLDIIYEDEYFIVVNKPPGLVVHPGAGHWQGTLVSGLLGYTRNLSDAGGEFRPGIVHRLDKDTSGLIVVAKNNEAHWKVAEKFSNREIYKEYIAFVWGLPAPDAGTIDRPIGRSKSNRKKFVVTPDGREAVTEYRVLSDYRVVSLVSLCLKTGRTHQARVHMKSIGHPVLGDKEYGGSKVCVKGLNKEEMELARNLLKVVTRQMLHACKLRFIHPFFNKELSLEAPLPDDFKVVEKVLKEYYNKTNG